MLEAKIDAHIEETKEKMLKQGQLFKQFQTQLGKAPGAPDDAAADATAEKPDFDPEYHKALLTKFDQMSTEFAQVKREVQDLVEKVEVAANAKPDAPAAPTVSPAELQEVKTEFENL